MRIFIFSPLSFVFFAPSWFNRIIAFMEAGFDGIVVAEATPARLISRG
jgi:hypothetical protein